MVVDEEHAARADHPHQRLRRRLDHADQDRRGRDRPRRRRFALADGVAPASANARVPHSGESTTWDGLTAGRYRLVELTTGRFTPTWNPGDVLEISSARRHASVLVTNDYGEQETGWIPVTKVVTGGLAPEGASFDVRLERGSEDGWTQVGTRAVSAGGTASWYGLAHGSYRLVELTEGTFTSSWSPSDAIELDDLHESAAVTLTNADRRPGPGRARHPDDRGAAGDRRPGAGAGDRGPDDVDDAARPLHHHDDRPGGDDDHHRPRGPGDRGRRGRGRPDPGLHG